MRACALAAHRACNDRASGSDVGLEILRQAWRPRHRDFKRLPVAHEMHEAANRIRFGGIIGNAGCFEDRRCRITASDPDGKYWLRMEAAAAMRLRDGSDRLCRGLRRSERGWNIHDKNGVVLGIFEQPLQRSGITGGIGVAGNVDGVGA
jgi:hypothetical protein